MSPEATVVVEDGQGIAGYIVGAYDTPPSKHGWNANGGQFCVPDMLAGVSGIHLGVNDGNHGGPLLVLARLHASRPAISVAIRNHCLVRLYTLAPGILPIGYQGKARHSNGQKNPAALPQPDRVTYRQKTAFRRSRGAATSLPSSACLRPPLPRSRCGSR